MRRAETVKEYLAYVPEAAKPTFEKLRAAIRSVMAADADEVISYGIAAFRRGQIVVWYAAFAKHSSVFPKADILRPFKDELKPYKVSKGTVQFPLDEPLPVALVKRIVKARLDEMNAAGKSPAKK